MFLIKGLKIFKVNITFIQYHDNKHVKFHVVD